MPESGDAFARLLRDLDGAVPPRPEFAEALLDRLLDELTGNPEGVTSSPDPTPIQPTTPPAVERQRGSGQESASTRRPRRFPTALATAALVVLAAVASLLVLAPGRLMRQPQAPVLIPALSGTATQTAITETLLDAATDVLPTSHALVEVHRWRMQPSSTPLTLWPQDGVVMIAVDSGAISASAAGTEHYLAAGDTLAPIAQEVALRAADSKDATVFVVYGISGWADPGLLERGQATGDSLAHAEDRLITASADGLPGGSARIVLERQILPPGSALAPEQVRSFAWFGVDKGALGLTLEGERLPFRWKSGAERTFRHGQFLPFLAAGTTMTLRNAGDDPLVLYRLTLVPGGARGSATGTQAP